VGTRGSEKKERSGGTTTSIRKNCESLGVFNCLGKPNEKGKTRRSRLWFLVEVGGMTKGAEHRVQRGSDASYSSHLTERKGYWGGGGNSKVAPVGGEGGE